MISDERQAALRAVAIRLAEVWANAGTIDGFSETEIPRDRPEAYFIQDQMAELIGQPCTGWKIGATSVKMREMEGHEDIIPGRLFPSTTQFANNLTLAIGGLSEHPRRDRVWFSTSARLATSCLLYTSPSPRD